MEAQTRFDAQHAFVLEVEHVEKIWCLLEEQGMVVKATVDCSDGIVRHYEEKGSLASYENPKRAAISAVSFSGRIVEPFATAEIDLGARYSKSVSVSISGEETLVSSMRMSISDIVDGMKPWYSRIAVLDLSTIWFSIFMVLLLLAQLMGSSGEAKPSIPFTKALSMVVVVAAVIGVVAFVIGGVSWLRNRYFPVATFALGQGASRHDHFERIRWAVIVAFVISLAASIATTWLFGV